MNRLPYRKIVAASSLAIAAALTGCSEKGATRYEVSELVGPSAFHGIHGIAAAPDGKLLVGSVVGQAIYSVDPATGAVAEFIGPPNGMADDIAFAPDGTMAWTGFLIGKVFVQKPGGRSSKSRRDCLEPIRSLSRRTAGSTSPRSSRATRFTKPT